MTLIVGAITLIMKKGTELTVPSSLSLVMVACCSVVTAGSHTALLEIYDRNRTDTGHSVPASPIALCRSEPLGKPRLTFVSDGNPFRRLLLGSKKNSLLMAVSPLDGFARHIPRWNCLLDSSLLKPA